MLFFITNFIILQFIIVISAVVFFPHYKALHNFCIDLNYKIIVINWCCDRKIMLL